MGGSSVGIGMETMGGGSGSGRIEPMGGNGWRLSRQWEDGANRWYRKQ